MVSYLVGGVVPNRYHLYVTPPGMFFQVWGVIYTSLAIVNI